MEIELVTTKKKITKSLVSQMRMAPTAAMCNGVVLGFVINAEKDAYRTVLILHGRDVFKVHAGWRETGETAVSRYLGRWSKTLEFGDVEEKKDWLSAYERAMKLADRQIYI